MSLVEDFREPPVVVAEETVKEIAYKLILDHAGSRR